MAEIVDALKEYFGNEVDGRTIDEVIKSATRKGLVPGGDSEPSEPALVIVPITKNSSSMPTGYSAQDLYSMLNNGKMVMLLYDLCYYTPVSYSVYNGNYGITFNSTNAASTSDGTTMLHKIISRNIVVSGSNISRLTVEAVEA